MMQLGSKRVTVVALGVAIVIACTLIAFGSRVYPVPGGDSYHFIPPAIMQAQGKGLLNPLSPFSQLVDPTGGHRYLQYPPLFSLVLAALMPEVTPRGAFLVIGFLGAASIILTATLLLRWAPHLGDGAAGTQAAALACALVGSATWFVGAQTGRPEVLATFLALLLMHVLSRRPGWLDCVVGGTIIGLAGAAHLVAGIILAIVTMMILALWLHTARAVVATVVSGATAVCTILGVITLGPFTVRDTLAGVATRARMVSMAESDGSLFYYWMTNPGATFLGAGFALFTLTAVMYIWWNGHCIRSRPIFLASGCVLLAFSWWSSLRVPETAYNLQFLTPIVFAATFVVVPSQRIGGNLTPALVRVAAVHLACSLGYFRYIALFVAHLAAGVSLDSARASFNQATVGRYEKIAASPALWVLTEDYSRLSICGAIVGAEACEGQLLVLQQSYSGLISPPPLEGFDLLVDRFVPKACRVAGFKVGSSVPGFGFALYERRVAYSDPPGEGEIPF